MKSVLQAGGMPAAATPMENLAQQRQRMHEEYVDRTLDQAEALRPDLAFEEKAVDLRRRLAEPGLSPDSRKFLLAQQDLLYAQRYKHAPQVTVASATHNAAEIHAAAVANDRARRERQEQAELEQRRQIDEYARNGGRASR